MKKVLLYDSPTLDEWLLFKYFELKLRRCLSEEDFGRLYDIYDTFVINRIQSRTKRRLAANSLFERQLNPKNTVNLCANKISQKNLFKFLGLNTAEFTLPGVLNSGTIDDFIRRVKEQIGDMPWIIKPTERAR